MREIARHDMIWIGRVMPPIVRGALRNFPGDVFLAGGWIRDVIRRTPPSDIDLFVTSEGMVEKLVRYLTGEENATSYSDVVKKHKAIVTQNAVTLRLHGSKLPIQIIRRWLYPTAEEVAQSFDFTVCQAVVRGYGPQLQGFASDTFYEDLAAMRLVYTKPVRNEDAGGSMLRLMKFYSKGFRATLATISGCIARLMSGVDPDKLNDVQRIREMTLEEASAHVLRGLLVEVDPNADPDFAPVVPGEGDNDEDETPAEATA